MHETFCQKCKISFRCGVWHTHTPKCIQFFGTKPTFSLVVVAGSSVSSSYLSSSDVASILPASAESNANDLRIPAFALHMVSCQGCRTKSVSMNSCVDMLVSLNYDYSSSYSMTRPRQVLHIHMNYKYMMHSMYLI